MSIRSWRGAAAFFALVSVACTNGSTVSRTRRPTTTEDRSVLVTATELSHYATSQSLLEALRIARPGFLFRRNDRPMVSIDGAPAGDQSILSAIRVSDVYEVRLIKAGSFENKPTMRPNGDTVIADLVLVITRASGTGVKTAEAHENVVTRVTAARK